MVYSKYSVTNIELQRDCTVDIIYKPLHENLVITIGDLGKAQTSFAHVRSLIRAFVTCQCISTKNLNSCSAYFFLFSIQ